MVRIGTAPPPLWQINHANSAYFRLFWGFFRVISATPPPFWISAPFFTYPGSAPETFTYFLPHFSSETELRLIFLQYCDLPPLITVEDRQSLKTNSGFRGHCVSRSRKATKIVAIFEKKNQTNKQTNKKPFITDCMCWISIRPTTNMTNHNNTATLCEIRNSVKILLGLVTHRVFTVLFMDFGET